nr:MAG TPA: hypothetical protein [Bacteriophage sp.]
MLIRSSRYVISFTSSVLSSIVFSFVEIVGIFTAKNVE